VAVDLILADGTVYPHKGRLDAVQRAVDSKTGTLAVRLLFPNPERVVRPGQYGRIRFVSETLPGAVCVPQKALSELQGVFQVAVVGEGNKAEIRTVKMGPRFGDLWVVQDGLKAGEKVVVEGLQSVKPGGEVNPKPIEEMKKVEGQGEKSKSAEAARPAGK
jgi:membrane fusion protein (multidrug efflux system)